MALRMPRRRRKSSPGRPHRPRDPRHSGALFLRRADRRADPGQCRLGRARARASPSMSPTMASTPTWSCPPARRASTGGRCCRSPTSPTCPADAEWIAFGAGERRVYLETPTWGDLTLKTAAIALTGGERVMHVEWVGDPAYAARDIRLTPEQYRRLWAAIRAGFELDREASRSASTIPATARATPSTEGSARPTRSTPATNGPPAASASPESRRRCGRRSSRGWCGGIGGGSEHVAAQVGVLGDPAPAAPRRRRGRSPASRPCGPRR